MVGASALVLRLKGVRLLERFARSLALFAPVGLRSHAERPTPGLLVGLGRRVRS